MVAENGEGSWKFWAHILKVAEKLGSSMVVIEVNAIFFFLKISKVDENSIV